MLTNIINNPLSVQRNKVLILIIAIFLASRIFVLLTWIDFTFQCEETHQGLVAKEIMEGPSLPLFEYQFSPHAGGTLLSGIITIPFFAIFGKNLFALKLTPLLFSALTLVVLFLFADRYFNRRVAIITSILFIFSPPIMIANTLSNQGTHAENIFFAILALFIFYEIIFNRKNKQGYFLLFGFICGLGTYWVYTFLVTLLVLFILWFFHDKKFFLRKSFFIFCLGFFIWLIPWLKYNLASEFTGVKEVFISFGGSNYFIQKTWAEMLWRQLNNISFPMFLNLALTEHFPFNFLSRAYLFTYWFGFSWILKRFRFSFKKLIYSPESFLIIFPILLITAATLYNSSPGGSTAYFLQWDYFLGLYPMIFLTVAITVDSLFGKIRVIKPYLAAIFIIFLFGAVTRYFQYLNLENFGSGFKEPGYSYNDLATNAFLFKYSDNFYKILDNITKLKEPQRSAVLSQTEILTFPHIKPVDFHEYKKLAQRLEPRYRQFFYKILICGLYSASKKTDYEMVKEVNPLAAEVEEAYRPYFYEGIGTAMFGHYRDNIDKHKEISTLIEERYRPYYFKGLTDHSYVIAGDEEIFEYSRRQNRYIEWMPDESMELYLAGLGEELSKIGLYMIADKSHILLIDHSWFLYEIIDGIEPRNKRQVLEGIGRNLSYCLSSNKEYAINKFIRRIKKEEDRIAIRKIMLDNLKHNGE